VYIYVYVYTSSDTLECYNATSGGIGGWGVILGLTPFRDEIVFDEIIRGAATLFALCTSLHTSVHTSVHTSLHTSLHTPG